MKNNLATTMLILMMIFALIGCNKAGPISSLSNNQVQDHTVHEAGELEYHKRKQQRQ